MKKLVQFIIIILFVIPLTKTNGQDVTRVYGKVTDAQTGEELMFVDVGFVNTYIGANTDDRGKYNLESRFATDTIYVSYLGYITQKIPITLGKKQELDIQLKSESIVMESVTVVKKREKYSKKNNPAIDLAKLIAYNKTRNSLKYLPYHRYDKHEKIRLDLNNITQDFKDNALVKNFDYAWDYIDTSEINGRTFLPLFFKETLSTIYYRKSDDKLKEHRTASKFTKMSEDWEEGTVEDILTALYQDIDIYEEDFNIVEMQFVSPLSSVGPDFYRYYIMDTIDFKSQSAIRLSFIPAVKGNRGFIGELIVTNDGRFTVLKIEMGVVKDINMNFIRDLKIIQEFAPLDTHYVKVRDEIVIDYSLSDNGLGMFGTRTVSYDNFNFDKIEDESLFDGIEKIVTSDSIYSRSDEYWKKQRIEALSKEEEKAYELVDRLMDDGRYKAYVYLLNTLSTGYLGMGPVELGIISTFYSFNDVEGDNIRIGGRTTYQTSKMWVFRFGLANARKINVWKYEGSVEYTFNQEWKQNPRHFIRLAVEKSNSFPGQELDFFDPDNFLLSFRRGRATDMIMEYKYEARYVKEGNGFNYSFGGLRRFREPYGSMRFLYTDPDSGVQDIETINTTEAFLDLRYAPNETFIQGKEKRRYIYNEYPIIELKASQGIKAFPGDFSFTRLYLNVFKQVEWTRIGTTEMIFEAGKTWGEVPYLLHFVPRGNQTYANFKRSYNMMNFLEFATDQFVSFNLEHFAYGFILNRIPLIKKLNLREAFSLKVFYGSLTSKNNPNINPELLQFTRDENNQAITHTLDGIPYIEAAVGLTNFLKVFRVDLVQRFTHLDKPRLPTLFGKNGMGIRFNFLLEF